MPSQDRRFTITPTGPFSLAQAASFGFGPREAEAGGAMRLAFAADGSGRPAGVTLREAADGTIEGEVAGDAPLEDVREQVARILSLEHDGGAWQDVGGRDPVLGELQARLPGLRPVLFHSPYEAAAWAVIVARSGRAQARKVRRTISERHGATFELAGETLAAFPSAEALLEIDEPIAEPDEREAASAAGHRAGRARGTPRRRTPARARARGRAGRAAGAAGDRPVLGVADRAARRRVHGRPAGRPAARAARRRAGLRDREPLTPEQFAELAEPWRPFRTWATVLLRIAGDRAGATGQTPSQEPAGSSTAAASATSLPHTSEST